MAEKIKLQWEETSRRVAKAVVTLKCSYPRSFDTVDAWIANATGFFVHVNKKLSNLLSFPQIHSSAAMAPVTQPSIHCVPDPQPRGHHQIKGLACVMAQSPQGISPLMLGTKTQNKS